MESETDGRGLHNVKEKYAVEVDGRRREPERRNVVKTVHVCILLVSQC